MNHAARCSRRHFLAACCGFAAVGVAHPLWGATRGRRDDPTHPEPRPGITAANVLPDSELVDYPSCQSAFDAIRKIPQIVDGIRCHCGCADIPGFYSLLSCYEGAGMARICEICQGQGRLAARLHKAGKTLDEIRTSVDARYG
jgi:hypothetical protein